MALEWVQPRKLHKGMTIGFLAPASSSDESLESIETICHHYGYKPFFGPSCRAKGLYGGAPEDQQDEFNWMMTNDDCNAVVALRGGYGTMRYIDGLDFYNIRNKRKAFVGYSDCTALHMAINRYSRLITYHGPMGVDWKEERQGDLDHLFAALEGRLSVIEPLPEPPRGAIGTELGEGVLRGGNMTLLSMLQGTPYDLEKDSLEDTILFLEDIGEAPYKLDRMLQQLRLAGILSRIKGMALGNFTGCTGDEDEQDYDLGHSALRYMEWNRPEELPEPFVCYLPTGHGAPHQTIPLGGRVSFRYISNTLMVYPYCKD